MTQRAFTSDDLLECYKSGIFPMADSRDDPAIYFVDPEERGIIPLGGLHISRSLRKALNKNDFRVTYDQCFRRVMAECAAPSDVRSETWINDGIKYLYGELFDKGRAHSVEVWREGSLIGGLYGVSIGGAFFGESMFSRQTNASKIALVHLVEHLNASGYVLLDTQFTNPHLETMGAISIPRMEYLRRLSLAITVDAKF